MVDRTHSFSPNACGLFESQVRRLLFPTRERLIRRRPSITSEVNGEGFGIRSNTFRSRYHVIGNGMEGIAIPNAGERHRDVSLGALLSHGSGGEISFQFDTDRDAGTWPVIGSDVDVPAIDGSRLNRNRPGVIL